MDTKVFEQLQRKLPYEHTDINFALRNGLDELNRALLDLIEAKGYSEETLISEAKETRVMLNTHKTIAVDWLVDRLTQTSIDYEVVRRA
jgi:hypothetical protein